MATSDYAAQADAVAAQYQIPASIFRSLIQTESGWDANAQADGSSAYGLTQLTRGTASDMGISDMTDPMNQLVGGARYLSQQYATFKNWTDALAAYNQGPGGVTNPAGQLYAQKVLAGAAHDPAVTTASSVDPNKTIAQNLQDGMRKDNVPGNNPGWLDTLIGWSGNAGLVILGIVVVGFGIYFASDYVKGAAVKAVKS